MNAQVVLVIVLFLVALFYIGRKIYYSIAQKEGSCNTGCGKCSANFDNTPDLKK